MVAKHHIVNAKNGWVLIKSEPSGQRIAVPELLRVELTDTRNGRDFFTVAEGVHKGDVSQFNQGISR